MSNIVMLDNMEFPNCDKIKPIGHGDTRRKFKTIVADPPWKFNDVGAGMSDRTVDQYPVMDLEAIKALPVGKYAEEAAHLYLWVPNSFMAEGHAVAEAWGFTPKTIITWVKLSKTGRCLFFGLGRYFRACTEHVIFATRGNLKLNNARTRNIFFGKTLRHSTKPPEFYDLVEECSSAAYLELFAREKREGWTVVGDEVDGCDIRDRLI